MARRSREMSKREARHGAGLSSVVLLSQHDGHVGCPIHVAALATRHICWPPWIL